MGLSLTKSLLGYSENRDLGERGLVVSRSSFYLHDFYKRLYSVFEIWFTIAFAIAVTR